MWIPTVRPEEEKSVKLGLYVGNCFFALWVDPKHTTISLRGKKKTEVKQWLSAQRKSLFEGFTP